jgi:hypothetical protein
MKLFQNRCFAKAAAKTGIPDATAGLVSYEIPPHLFN